jgi:hypothetical protein
MTWDVLNPGIWVIFGVVGLPVYVAFLGWFLGKPRQYSTSMLGVSVFLSLVLSLWGGLYAITMVIRFFFFG